MVNCHESSSEPIQELEMELEPDKEVEGFLDALKVGVVLIVSCHLSLTNNLTNHCDVLLCTSFLCRPIFKRANPQNRQLNWLPNGCSS
jgi:hypothetical protein